MNFPLYGRVNCKTLFNWEMSKNPFLLSVLLKVQSLQQI
jgi:hypothetical protein